MLDIHFFREHFNEVKAKLSTKHFAVDWDAVRASDVKRLEALKAFEAARARQQAESKALASLDKTSEAFKGAVRNLKVLSDKTKQLEAASKTAEAEFQALWLTVPNIPDASVPIGKTSQENKELYQRHPQNEDFSHACPHYELPNFEHEFISPFLQLNIFKRGRFFILNNQFSLMSIYHILNLIRI